MNNLQLVVGVNIPFSLISVKEFLKYFFKIFFFKLIRRFAPHDLQWRKPTSPLSFLLHFIVNPMIKYLLCNIISLTTLLYPSNIY
jgi:hypothetical protein